MNPIRLVFFRASAECEIHGLRREAAGAQGVNKYFQEQLEILFLKNVLAFESFNLLLRLFLFGIRKSSQRLPDF